jgi:hypothetical protein
LLSLRPVQNFKAYFGQQVSIDGWTYIVGFKASGLKVLIPWTARIEDERIIERGWLGLMTAHAAVGALCLATNYFYTSLHCENRLKEVERWKEKNVDLIAEKQTAFDTLMHDRAARN